MFSVGDDGRLSGYRFTTGIQEMRDLKDMGVAGWWLWTGEKSWRLRAKGFDT